MDDVTTPNPQPGVRIGTAERESAISALGEHMAAGRLEPDEYSDRVTTASAARTREDLDALFTDLPAPHPFPQPAASPQPARSWQRYVPESPAVRVLAAVLAVVVLMSALPFVAAAAILWFFVLPAVTCSGPWHRYRGPWRAARWR